MSMVNINELCRLCLVKDTVVLPIFESDLGSGQLYLKIRSCLPVKVEPGDKLPQKICQECGYKVELLYQFVKTSVGAEKQLLNWLGQVGELEDKQGYATEVLDSSVLKQEGTVDSRLDGSVMQVTGPSNLDINLIDNMSIITMADGSEQQFTTVPIDGSVQTVQIVTGTSADDQIVQSQVEEEEDEEEDNYDDGCDNDDSMAVKEETEEVLSERTLEPAFVSLPCDEAGPSGLQHKIPDISEMSSQTADDDPKPGFYIVKLESLPDIKPAIQNDGTLLLNPSQLQLARADGLVVVPPEGLYECALCGEVFNEESHFEKHRKTLHGSHPVQQEVIHQEIVTDETNVLMYACERCPRTFPDETSYQKHQETSHADDDAAAALDQVLSCGMCHFSTSNRQDLLIHEQRHSRDIKFKCEKCGDLFEDEDSIKKHTCRKLLKCDQCPATYLYKQGLRLHAKTHMPGYKESNNKHPCPICNKRFVRRQVMNVHMKTHGDRSAPPNEHKCDICGKGVSSKTYLDVHMRKHTGEKPFKCDICGAGYISQNYLSVHRRTHTGERPHVCQHCGKAFTQRTTMVVHERRHTGIRPYTCNQCPKGFASKTMLNSHLKTHAKFLARQSDSFTGSLEPR